LEKDLKPVEATVRNFGQIIPSGMLEGEWFEYAKISLDTYLSIQKEYDISIRQNGSTYIASTIEEMNVLQEISKKYKDLHYLSELLDARECIKRLPCVRPEYCKGGLFFPQEVTAEPGLMIHRLLQYLIAKYDLNYLPSTPIKDLQVNNTGVEILDSKGVRYFASRVLVCTGRDFQFLMPDLFQKSDLELVKLQMMETMPLPEVHLPGSILSGLSIKRYYAFKSCPSYKEMFRYSADKAVLDAQIHILFKQSLDGSIIIGDSHEYADVALEQTMDYGIDEDINTLILKEAKKILNLPHWNIRRSWNGYYSQSKSSEIYDHFVDDKIQVVTGIGGKGMTTSCGYAFKNIERNYPAI
jgi:FAD dependent oxidoreductase TIGR03364